MATPYPGMSGGTQDSYDIYHSQLKIQIECAFGILPMRWAILRITIPVNVTQRMTVALVFCIITIALKLRMDDMMISPILLMMNGRANSMAVCPWSQQQCQTCRKKVRLLRTTRMSFQHNCCMVASILMMLLGGMADWLI
jgi:hypothetical protein